MVNPVHVPYFQEAVIEKFVKYYKAIFHHNSWYFAIFVMCELLNFVLLFAQFQMTDNFLSKKFRWWPRFYFSISQFNFVSGMVGRRLSITTSTVRRRGGVLNWD